MFVVCCVPLLSILCYNTVLSVIDVLVLIAALVMILVSQPFVTML